MVGHRLMRAEMGNNAKGGRQVDADLLFIGIAHGHYSAFGIRVCRSSAVGAWK